MSFTEDCFDYDPTSNPAAGYRQCVLQNGSLVQTSWLPERFAVVGKKLRLRNDNKVWTGMWEVLQVHSYLTEEQLKRNDRRNHRLGVGRR